MNSQIEQDSNEYDRLLDALENMHQSVVRALKQHGPLPMADSKALIEIGAISDPFLKQVLVDLVIRTGRAMNAAGEAVEGTSRLLRLPPLKFMPGPVVRAGLEAAGPTLWLLAPDIPPETRVGRAVAIKKEDLNLDLALAQAGVKIGPAVSQRAIDASNEALQWSKEQREVFLRSASRSGIKNIPLPTDRALATLANGEYEYVLTSGLAHGSTTVYGAVNGMLQGPSSEAAGVMIMSYATTVADAYGRAAWALSRHVLNEASQATIPAVLDSIYDGLQMTEEPRGYFKGGLQS